MINFHDVTEDQTVSEWLAQWDISVKFTAQDFLQLKLTKVVDLRNIDRIKAKYTEKEATDNLNKLPGDVLIKAGTTVGLPNAEIKRSVVKVLPDLSQLTDFSPFIAQQLKNLLKEPRYYSEIRDVSSQMQGRTDNNDLTVYAWIRSINRPGSNVQNGAWINISPFVEALNTTVTKAGGVFNMLLSPANVSYDSFLGWEIENMKGYDIQSAFSGSRQDAIFQTAISKSDKENNLIRINHFFKTVLRENDLIYIRFEKLAMERERTQKSFGASDVPGNVYDMIGLVDAVGVSTSGSQVSTQVQGRDLMKLLIEDGSIFFPEQIGQNIFTDKDSKLARRNLIEFYGHSLINAGYSFKPISTILKFIFNKFSNLGMVPSSVFSGYGDKFNKSKFRLETSSLLKTEQKSVIDQVNDEFLNQNREGVWGIIDLVFDFKSANRVLADNTIATDNGSIINTIRKFCQEPFVEFYGDTYGDRYNFIVRKEPIDAAGYRGLVYGNSVSESESDGVNALGNPIKLRTPSLDKLKTITGSRPGSSISSLVIDIDETDVISDSLNYSNEVYSWYRVVPRGFGVSTDISSFLLAPVIPLDEYAEIWGNKTYTLEYNYCPAQFIDDSFADKQFEYAESQTFLDLQFIIQGHAYLPFTRQGTIKINGNRTIKRGMPIYYKPTGEIYFVDVVNNSRILNDRTTTLSVSRGMREKFIKGVEINFRTGKKLVSYFDIVGTKIENKASIENTDFLKNWKVDPDIFNFFIQGRQWTV